MSSPNFGLVSTMEELEALFNRLRSSDKLLGFDIETGYSGEDREKGSLEPSRGGHVVGFSITDDPSWARYVPLRHDVGPNLDPEAVWAVARDVLESDRIVAHNAKFEARFMRKEGINLGVKHDSMIEAFNLSRWKTVGLKHLTKEVFGYEQAPITSLFPDMKKKDEKFLRFSPLDSSDPEVIAYACDDAVWTLALHNRFWPDLQGELAFTHKTDMAVLKILVDMEECGVGVDWEGIASAQAAGEAFLEEFERDLIANMEVLAKTPLTGINLNSTKQLRDLLYVKLGLPVTKMTDNEKNPQPSTDAVALERLAQKEPAIRQLLEMREVKNLLARLNKWLQFPSEDGRVRASYNQAVIASGRFSANDPAIQQCVDGVTEVLTPGGWVKFRDLEDGVPVAQYHPEDSSVSFVVPDVLRQTYDGPMLDFHLWGRTFRYTPDHRILTQARRQETWFFEEADDWRQRLEDLTPPDRLFPRAGWHREGVRLSDEERHSLLLAVIAQAEGNLRTDGREDYYDVVVRSQRKADRLRSVALLEVKELFDRFRVSIPRSSVERWLDSSKEKNFLSEPILRLHSSELRWFVDEVMLWDGDATRGDTYGQKVSRRTSVDLVQAAAALSGQSTSLYERPHLDAVTVNVNDRDKRQVGRTAEVTKTESDGMVYCVTVPTGAFITRRDGLVLATGNCPKDWKWSTDTAEWSGNFRKFIAVADEDHYYLGFDYSQIELRVLAALSQEPALLEAFRTGEDVHTVTASKILGIPVSEVDPKVDRPVGKAQPLDEPVLTPSGWSTMDELREGDFVVGSDGLPTKVSGVFPQGSRPVFRLEFSDGAVVRADEEHLWSVTTQNDRRRGTARVMTTAQIKDYVETHEEGLHVPLTAPVHAPEADLPIDPWLLGFLLGDGCLSSNGVVFSCGEQDAAEITAKVEASLPESWGLKVKPESGNCFRISGNKEGGVNRLSRALLSLDLKGTVSENKFVPEIYLSASIEQRLELLRGLMDADGYAGSGEFCSASERLAEGVQHLVRSLGGCFRVAKKPTSHQMAYRGNVQLSLTPFALERKVHQWEARGQRSPQRRIERVSFVNHSPCVCISVGAPDSLYLTTDFVVTHNTMNFGLLYGMSIKGLADRLGISKEEAEEKYNAYFAGLPSIKVWMDRVQREGRKENSTVSWIGRKAAIWELVHPSRAMQAKGDRMLVNVPVQGGAADYMKIAMIRCEKVLREKGWWNTKVRLLMNQHDHLGFEVHNSLPPKEVVKILKPAVEIAVKGWPPVDTDWEFGPNWGDAEEFGDDTPLVFEDGVWRVEGEAAPEPPSVLDQLALDEEPSDKPEPEVEESPPGDPHLTIVQLTRMPSKDEWVRFLDYARQPGDNDVVVRTPQGEVPIDLTNSAVGPDNETEVRLIIPGARVFRPASSVNVDDLVGSLEL